MKSLIWGVLAILGACAAAGCGESEAATSMLPDRVARGKYLVSVIGCGDCHTPLKMGPQGPEPDLSRLLAGHPQELKMPKAPEAQGPWMVSMAGTATAFAGPWGVSYTMNLTPDVNTGLGIWTEDMFVRALREGKHMGQSRPIQPPMPWQFYRNMTDEDLKSVYAYLRTIPAVHNRVPEYEPPAAPEEE